MKFKRFIAVLAITASAVALSGCSLSRYTASLDPYAPSDGVQLDIQNLKARNLMLIQGASGNAILIGSFVNSGTSNVTANLQTKDLNGEEIRLSFEVAAGKKFDLGYNGTEGVILKLDAVPGSMHSVYLAGDSDPVEILVPVMDGSLEEYRQYSESLN